MKLRASSETEGDYRNSNKRVFYRQIVLEEELGGSMHRENIGDVTDVDG
jgi:hypothetical protein